MRLTLLDGEFSGLSLWWGPHSLNDELTTNWIWEVKDVILFPIWVIENCLDYSKDRECALDGKVDAKFGCVRLKLSY